MRCRGHRSSRNVPRRPLSARAYRGSRARGSGGARDSEKFASAQYGSHRFGNGPKRSSNDRDSCTTHETRKAPPMATLDPATPFRTKRHRHLLVPLDGSETAEVVLPDAASVAVSSGARITLLHVVPPALAEIYAARKPSLPTREEGRTRRGAQLPRFGAAEIGGDRHRGAEGLPCGG
jgi:hypothetical protein